MIITHFGTSYPAGSPLFGTIQAVDDWSTMRPAVTQQVSGASGVFDFFANAGYPVSPITVGKRFTVTAATYAGIETELDTLRAAVFPPDPALGTYYRLWGLPRGGNPLAVNDFRWAYAKCTSFKPTESYSEANYLKMPVEMTFLCPEGQWYGQARTYSQVHSAGASNITNQNNAGNFPALLYVKVTPTSSSLTSCVLSNPTPAVTTPTWTFTGTVLATKDLIVDARSYVVTNDGADAYTDLGSFGSHVAWMWLTPGLNTLTITLNTASTVYLEWFDMYLL